MISEEEKEAITNMVKAEMAAERKRRAGGAAAARKRRAPTSNPLRERKEREEKKELSSSTGGTKAVSAASAAVIGGYGILYSVKADEFLFARRKGRNTEAELLEAANKKSDDDSCDVVPRPVVVPKDLPRLLHVKGRRRPFCMQVERTWQSLNSGDCFVLDEGKFGKCVYQWNGKDANRMEKGKAMDIAKNIREKERFNSRVVLVEQGSEPEGFWAALGGRPPAGQQVAGKEQGGDDDEAERAYGNYVTLYKVVHTGQAARNTDVELECVVAGGSGKRLVKSMLVPGCCFILDCVSEVYAWTDTQVSGLHRRGALVRAALLLAEEHAKQCWVAPVYHEWAGSEQVMFRERFYGWNTPPIAVHQPGAEEAERRMKERKAAPSLMDARIDVAAMYAGTPRTSDDVMVDDGTGTVTVFLVDEFRRVRVEDSAVGEFYSGDSCVVLYRYVWKNKDCYLIYFWQGRAATVLNKGSSAALTMELDDKLKATIEAALSKEIRVVQGKEPRHFLTVFADRFIVHDGRDPRATATTAAANAQQESKQQKKVRLYQVAGSDAVHTHAVEKTLAAAESLNPSSVFVVVDCARQRGFVWVGRWANEFEKKHAKLLVPRLQQRFGVELLGVAEGSEPEELWESLGTDSAHARYPDKGCGARVVPRLFVCSVGSGAFSVEEVAQFSQDDLDADDAIILDAHSTVFVWIGVRSHPAEQKLAMDTAVEYCAHAAKCDASRPRHVPCLRVVQHEEPITFTTNFHGWQDKPPAAATTKTGARSQSKAPQQQAQRSYDGNTMDVEGILKELNRKYSYKDLLEKRYPRGLDESALETYLEDTEFEKLFGMERDAFARLPMWQRVNLKRKLRLW